MKTTTMLLALAVLPLLVQAQTKTVSEFYAKYRQHDEATFVDIDGSIFNFMSGISKYVDDDDEDKKDVEAASRILGEIKSMQVLSIPYKYISAAEISTFRKNLKKEKYEPLMTVHDSDADIDILAQGSQKELENITFLIDEEDHFVLISFQGTLSMEDVAYLAKNKNSWQ